MTSGWPSRLRVRRPAVDPWVAGVVVTVGCLSLLARWVVPPLVFGNALHDDRHFVEQSLALSDGRWLGSFGAQLTLSKGMAYPAFLALCRAIDLSPFLGQQLLLLAAAGVMARVAWRLTGSTGLALCLYSVLALDPAHLGTLSSRVLRDGWYAALSLLLIGLVALALCPPAPRARPAGLGRALTQGAVVGVALAAYWLGREERPWLLPALAVLVLGGVLEARRRSRADPSAWPVAAARAVAALGVVVLAVSGVKAMNETYYGASITNDMIEGGYPAAHAQWQAVEAGPARPYVPISKAQRQAAYAVSPAARELQPWLEGPAALIGPGCEKLSVCDDIAGGWMPWSMRVAVELTGRYPSAASSQAYYWRLVHELRAACEDGRLTCGPVMPSMLPTPDGIRAEALLVSAERAVGTLVRWDLARQRPDERSRGTAEHWEVFERGLAGLPDTLGEQRDREARFHGSAPQAAVSGLGTVYRWGATALLPLALLGLVLAGLRRPSRAGSPVPEGLWLLGFACLLAVTTRVGLLALIDSTSFPATRSSYLECATGPFAAVLVLGSWMLLRSSRPAPADGQARSSSLGSSRRSPRVRVRATSGASPGTTAPNSMT